MKDSPGYIPASETPPSGFVRKLADLLYSLPARRTPKAIFGWWERRRPAYNLIVGSAGAVTTAVAASVITLFGGGLNPGMARDGLLAILAFGAAANLWYTAGPVCEIALQKLFGNRVRPLGPHLFRAGLVFSVGLALLPLLWGTMALTVVAIGGLLGLS